jgi:hypothetical protein
VISADGPRLLDPPQVYRVSQKRYVKSGTSDEIQHLSLSIKGRVIDVISADGPSHQDYLIHLRSTGCPRKDADVKRHIG